MKLESYFNHFDIFGYLCAEVKMQLRENLIRDISTLYLELVEDKKNKVNSKYLI